MVPDYKANMGIIINDEEDFDDDKDDGYDNREG